MKLTTHLQLVPRSRKCGSIHPFPHTPSWSNASLVKHRENFTFFQQYIGLQFMKWTREGLLLQVSLTKNNFECKGDQAVVDEESQQAQRRLIMDLNRPQLRRQALNNPCARAAFNLLSITKHLAIEEF
jgi:hypothetical protein